MTDVDIERMTLEQTRAAAQELLDNTTGDLAGADADRFQALSAHAEQLRQREQQRATARRDIVQRLASGDYRTEGEGHSLPGTAVPAAATTTVTRWVIRAAPRIASVAVTRGTCGKCAPSVWIRARSLRSCGPAHLRRSN